MEIKELVKKLDSLCQLEMTEEWDNSGVQIEIPETDVKKVLVALEVSKAVVEEAKRLGADLVVTHHPLFFVGFITLTEELLPTRYALELIKAGISVYSAHTNFDKMEGGNNDYFGRLLGIGKISSQGFISLGEREETTVTELAKKISETLDIEERKIRTIGNPTAKVRKIAWCTGAGGDYIMDAMDLLGADIYITGDIKYHDATTISELGFNALDVGHFGSEKIFTPNMAAILRANLPELEIIESAVDTDPFQ